MTVRQQTVSFTEPLFAYAQAVLVDAGEYPSVSAAVSGRNGPFAAPRVKHRRLCSLPWSSDRFPSRSTCRSRAEQLAEVTGEARARLAELRSRASDRSPRMMRHNSRIRSFVAT